MADWAKEVEEAHTPGSPNWEKLIDDCIDEYLVANPNSSDDWTHTLAERGFEPDGVEGGYLGVARRPP